jgi:mannosyl-3-phosphoglycerate phosphatase
MQQLKTKTVIFADLDGTLLDEKYECKTTKPIVDKLAALGGSIVFCSSKTRSEIEYYRKAVGVNEPFISENGAAIYIPKNYFPFNYACTKTPSYNIIKLGASYETLRQKLSQIKRLPASKIVGFGDMTIQEIAHDSGLTLKLAELAKKREHDEPFKIVEGNRARILQAIKSEGLFCTEGGRYFHLIGNTDNIGNTDKGKAVAILKALYFRMFGKVESFGIGDGPNDLPMLKVVDRPFLIRKTAGLNASFLAWRGILQLVGAKV